MPAPIFLSGQWFISRRQSSGINRGCMRTEDPRSGIRTCPNVVADVTDLRYRANPRAMPRLRMSRLTKPVTESATASAPPTTYQDSGPKWSKILPANSRRRACISVILFDVKSRSATCLLLEKSRLRADHQAKRARRIASDHCCGSSSRKAARPARCPTEYLLRGRFAMMARSIVRATTIASTRFVSNEII